MTGHHLSTGRPFWQPDCIDDETLQVLSAFFQIGDPRLRRMLLGIIRNVPNDEGAAIEMLELVEEALEMSEPDMGELRTEH